MDQFKSLTIIGGCSLELTKEGTVKTKSPLSKYFFDLSRHFDEVNLYAPISHTNFFSGSLKHPKLNVHQFGPKAFARLTTDFLHGPKKYLLLHLPNAAFVAPFLPMLKWRIISSGVYLGIDFTYQGASQGTFRSLRRAAFRAAHKMILRSCDFVIARGAYLARVCSHYNNSVFETIPLGHMLENFSDRAGVTIEPSLLYVGKVLKRKGIDILLGAMSRLNREKGRSIRLDVVGDGDDLQWAAAEAKHLGLGEEVSFHGWIDNTDRLEDFWANASTLIVPTSTSEGVPRVIEEAIIRSLPVVATRVGGIADEFRNGEIVLIPANEPETMANALEKILFDSAFRRENLSAAKPLAERLKAQGSAGDQHAGLLLSNANSKNATARPI